MKKNITTKANINEMVIDRQKVNLKLMEIINDLSDIRIKLTNDQLSKEDGLTLIDKSIKGSLFCLNNINYNNE